MEITGQSEQNEKAPSFPNFLAFNWRLRKILNEIKKNPTESLPPLPDKPLASDVVKYAHEDWKKLNEHSKRRNNKGLGTYLFELAKHIRKPPSQGMETSIKITSRWGIIDGRHTVLALKVLGEDYVKKSGIDNLIKVEKY